MTSTILVVDDSSYMRGVIKRMLAPLGATFLEAADGDAAVATYKRHKPDVVLLDIVMPVKSGVEALREIRANDSAARIIIVSAVGQDLIIKDALSMGASDFIVKPFDEPRLQEVVRKVIGAEPA